MSSTSSAARRQFRGRLALTLLLSCLLLATGPLILLQRISSLRAHGQFHDQIFSLVSLVVDAQGRRISSDFVTGRFLLEHAITNPELVDALNIAIQFNNRDDPDLTSYRQEVLDQLQTINRPRHIFDQFLVILPDGTIQLSSRQEWEGQRLTGNQSLLGQNGGKTLSAIYSYPPLYPDSFIVITSIPYLDRQGNAVATFLAITESQTIWDKVSSTMLPSTSQFFVTGDGHFIGINPFTSSSNRMIILFPDEPYKQAVLNGLAGDDRQGVVELKSFSGPVNYQAQSVFVAFSWIPELEAGWVVEIPQASFYSSFITLQWLASLMLLSTLALFLLIYWKYDRQIVKPIVDLSVTLRRFAEGNWELRLPVQGHNEVGRSNHSFNLMAEKLAGAYQSLESRLEESSNQLRMIAGISQIATTSSNLDEFLMRTANLLVERLAVIYTAIFLVDNLSESITLSLTAGSSEYPKIINRQKLKIDPRTPVGKAAFDQHPNSYLPVHGEIPSDERMEPVPEARFGLALPILAGNQVLGIIDMQSLDPDTFSQENLLELQLLSDTVALGIQKFDLAEGKQTYLQDGTLFLQSSQRIAQAETDEQVLRIFRNTLRQTPFFSTFLLAESEGLRPVIVSDDRMDRHTSLPDWLPVPPEQVEATIPLSAPVLITDFDRAPDLPDALLELLRQLDCTSAALLPVVTSDRISAILVLATHQKSTDPISVLALIPLDPYMELAELVIQSLEKIRLFQKSQQRMSDLEILNGIREKISFKANTNISSRTLEPDSLVKSILNGLNQLSHVVKVSLYLVDVQPVADLHPEAQEALIQGRTIQNLIPQNPGSDISPENPTPVLGALAVPVTLHDQVIGVLNLRFSVDNPPAEVVSLVEEIAVHLAFGLENIRLFEDSQRQAKRERLVSEISAKLRASNDPEVILKTMAQELLQALGASQAQVLLQKRSTSPEKSDID